MVIRHGSWLTIKVIDIKMPPIKTIKRITKKILMLTIIMKLITMMVTVLIAILIVRTVKIVIRKIMVSKTNRIMGTKIPRVINNRRVKRTRIRNKCSNLLLLRVILSWNARMNRENT